MRLTKAYVPLGIAAALALGGCGGPGPGGTTTPTAAPAATGRPGDGWIVTATGSATPTPSASLGTGTPPTGLPPVSFLPVDPDACPQGPWTVAPVEIPLTVTPAAGSLTVTWPRQYDSDYRITAVPQPLIAGDQPTYTWRDVPAGAGCRITATITGLRPGTPYVVWVDAPNTGYLRDGTRHPYSGRSGVVYPR